eukprot:TRINITY_DN50323_c0_g1_i1.p1 TRINITY_DN50323_c0_g1~~TRINITY_DN50323_c0_g1_i1.p1  ORF type:complete len:195 (+),score=29.01 TRINITY_DN50323_c0_g1_i1:73-585(+)
MAAVRFVVFAVSTSVLSRPAVALFDTGLVLNGSPPGEPTSDDSDPGATLKRLVMQLAGALEMGDGKSNPIRNPADAGKIVDVLVTSVSDPATVQMFQTLKSSAKVSELLSMLKSKLFDKLAVYGITQENFPSLLKHLSLMMASDADPALKEKIGKVMSSARALMSIMEAP